MSTTIDQKVVEMRFDNKNFEKNTKQTMSTLDKLKEKLNFTGASKGLENINASANKVNMNGITNAVETVRTKFSALEVVGVTALANITNSAVNAGKQLLKSLSIDQITAGFDKFGKKTTSVATLQAQGFAIEEVNDQLDRLNWFTDETSYNYTDMVENISKFTATGKGLTESVNAMEGIATWAALSGQNAQKASSAMYQLSQALGAGMMRKEDYKSIQNVSMDTDEFRQKALDAAVALGTLKKNSDGTYKSLKATGSGAEAFSKSQFAESLTEGKWFTSDVMMKVFGEYSKAVDEIYKVTEEKGMLASEVIDEIHTKAKTEGISTNEAIKALGYNFDEFALKAFEAGQKARTFTDAIDATKDAVSTGWMKTFEIIFGNAEEATELWTDLANSLWDVFASGGEARNEMLKGWKDLGGRDALVESFWNSWEAIASIINPIREAFRDIFPPTTSKRLVEFTEKLKEVTANFKISDETAAKLKSTFKGVFAFIDIVITALSKAAGGAIKVISGVLGFAKVLLSGSAAFGDWVSKTRDSIKETNLFGRAVDAVVGFLQKAIDKLKEFGNSVKEGFKAKGYEGFVGFLKAIYEIVIHLKDIITQVFGGLGKAVAKAFGQNNVADVINSGLFSTVLVGLYKFIDKLTGPIGSLSDIMDKITGKKMILDVRPGRFDKLKRAVRNKMVELGLNETLSYALIPEGEVQKYSVENFETVKILDPMTEERNALRYSLLPSLKMVYDYNKARSQKDISIFEIGKSFYKKEEKYGEELHLAALMTGNYKEGIEKENVDFYVIKGVMEGLLDYFGYNGKYSLEVKDLPEELHPGQSASIVVDGANVGIIGKIHPNVTKDNIFVMEINLDKLFNKEHEVMKYKEISKFPNVVKDVAFIVKKNVKSEEIEKVIKSAGGKRLRNIEVFDVYTGENVSEDEKSIAYTLTFNDFEKTLSDEEVTNAFNKIIKEVTTKCEAVLRDK